MHVSELFYSLQGEGLLTGVPSVFVRLAGCSLRCRWCDTKYCWDPNAGPDHPIDEIVEAVRKFSCRHTVITGGEPMQNAELPDLAGRMKTPDMHITIETSGIVFVPNLACDLMSISPKTANAAPNGPDAAASHERMRLDIGCLRELTKRYDYQLKFVVESETDLAEIQEIINDAGSINPEKVFLMPQAVTRDELLAKSPLVAELCKRTGYSFCGRLQVMLWNGRRGT